MANKALTKSGFQKTGDFFQITFHPSLQNGRLHLSCLISGTMQGHPKLL